MARKSASDSSGLPVFKPPRLKYAAAPGRPANSTGRSSGDADMQGYFDNIQRDTLLELVKERISDRRVLKLIRQ